ncbi:serine/threonine-protein kinase [Colletotrichum plurivorum]|uniref:Serine/threonine-protein kinase n=1 Tax=Colletotrichum plurivorum TaxID=2175906 RepID=A0A8H6MS81_9PEZI|nr:serine/threonine-protein kinase [Colletotrichum plurivorum]
MNVEIEHGGLHELQASANTSPPIAPDLLATRFKILDKSEAFEDVDGEFKFTKTLVVYTDGKNIYHAVSKARGSEVSNLSINQLTAEVLIPATAYSPLFVPTFTRAPDPLPSNTYVKKPSLLSYDRIHHGLLKNNIVDNVLAEVQVCELLKQNPHPNIARYLGCQVLDGRIVGICFAKYEKTLMEAVNPNGFMKRKFSTTRQDVGNHSQQLDGIEDGIKHLHSLELVHNDLNPSNIMIDGSRWVIIDFGSCRYKGESLDDVGRTYEWFDEAVHSSLPQNDLDALREIRNWLEGAPPDAFQFKE